MNLFDLLFGRNCTRYWPAVYVLHLNYKTKKIPKETVYLVSRMCDHFMILEDRFLTESTLEAAIQSKNRLQHASPLISQDMTSNFSFHRMDIEAGSSPRKLVECKICKDEDEASTMEVPCSCRGSLKVSLLILSNITCYQHLMKVSACTLCSNC